MGTTVLTKNVELVYEECIVCGIAFAFPVTMRNHAQKHGGFYHCPNGHSQGWSKQNCQSETDKLRDEVAKLQSNLKYKDDQFMAEKDRAEKAVTAQKRKTAAVKGELTKTRKRIGNGVCPCCNRHFVNVERHMKTKHPEAVV